MVCSKLFRLAVVVFAVGCAQPALAAPLNLSSFTGNVPQDLNPTTNSNVEVIQVPDAIDRVAQSSWMTANGWVTGWNIKDIRTLYDKTSDTLVVGINFFGIAGDSDGNGNPGGADPKTIAAGGVDPAHLGGRKSITVAIDPNHSGAPSIVAGVPADKSAAGPGVDGFTVSNYKNTNEGLAFSYGANLPSHQGQLLFDPSAQHPGFEFTITNFSKIPGINLHNGFGIEAFAGSPDDVVAGEDFIAWTNVPAPLGQQVPEPASAVLWTFVIGGVAYRLRRVTHRRGSSRS